MRTLYHVYMRGIDGLMNRWFSNWLVGGIRTRFMMGVYALVVFHEKKEKLYGCTYIGLSNVLHRRSGKCGWLMSGDLV